MKFGVLGAALAASLCIAGIANATTYTITVPGTVTTASAGGPFHIGDSVTMSTVFSDANFVVWGDSGFMVMATSTQGFPGLPAAGPSYFRIDMPGGVVINSRYDLCSGCGIYYYDNVPGGRYFGGPSVIFTDTQVLGIDNMWQDSFQTGVPGVSAVPLGGPYSQPGDFHTIPFGTGFHFSPSWVPGFTQSGDVTWNFAAATVLRDGVAVPEPSTWAMLIAGFGLIGLALRRRRLVARA